ncbi:methyltransferase family protein [Mobilisporobacter senegalensis]|uniref:Methyltransferase family protein n=1 Tax=Mobilisporobacter senegalensis TaxID=1329262 RepID=A0A3N1XYZ9_9FIRM|nr:class I SAM-dependent methyltransferase [Mobilisporobacter senegalensis]ROR31471.1 methyltransferase family protein [Mobilisporobacter senegalensis]
MEDFIGNVKMNYKFYKGIDLYSDGEVEDIILDIVKYRPQCEYEKIIMQEKSWPIFYHLSNLRTNIVEWIPINENSSVLEIGSGCGAITGALANKCKKITCIDLSKKRSEINAYRNKDKSNINIIVGNFQDVEKELTEQYDYITLIGVFEYGEYYIQSDKPYLEFLKIISKHLKKNGRIIIAIENKIGMKYWAGSKEDHVGKYYESIEGYTKSKGVKTFTKLELEEICNNAGFKEFKFYYPYPDYKFTTTIYSDDYLPQVGSLNNNIRNYDMDRLITFDESKAYDTVIRNNLFPLYSNSYLLILTKSEG